MESEGNKDIRQMWCEWCYLQLFTCSYLLNRNIFNSTFCGYMITISLLLFCGLTAYISFIVVLAPNSNRLDEVFINDEKLVTMDITAASKGD